MLIPFIVITLFFGLVALTIVLEGFYQLARVIDRAWFNRRLLGKAPPDFILDITGRDKRVIHFDLGPDEDLDDEEPIIPWWEL